MRTLALTLVLTTLAACEGVSGREARGRLDLSGTSAHANTLVAIDDLGRRETVALDDDGSFSIALDEGRSYAIGFADSESTRRGVLAQLVLRRESGWRSQLHIQSGPAIDFGVVRPASREVEIEIETEHAAVEPGDDNGGDRGCRDLTDDGSIDVLPQFLVVGDRSLLDDNGIDPPGDDSQLRDEDGDLSPDSLDDDLDGDGVCDDSPDDDAGVPDADAGEDDSEGRADLPYDVRPGVGDTVQLSLVFLEKGPAPARILSVEMESPAWRLEELSNDTPFVVNEADCAHEGNRDIGRDRIYVAWENVDGSREVDHLDLRYCE